MNPFFPSSSSSSSSSWPLLLLGTPPLLSPPPSSSSSCSSLLSPPPSSSSSSSVLPLLASLPLHGFHALPIRLKILLDRLFDWMPGTERDALLAKCGWSPADYARGYQANPPSGPVWHCVPLHTELRLLVTVAAAVPELAPLAHSLRQSAFQSLFAYATAGGSGSGEPEGRAEDEKKKEDDEDEGSKDEAVVDLSMPSSGRRATTEENGGKMEEDDEHDEETDDGTSGRETKMESEEAEGGGGGGRSTSSTVPAATPPAGCRRVRGPIGAGKRRVQCPACLKTYCDKGALKIHTSAVHLKETHFCTVPGCERAFSSRRSRNRHSLNANMHAALLITPPAMATTTTDMAEEKRRDEKDEMEARIPPHTVGSTPSVDPQHHQLQAVLAHQQQQSTEEFRHIFRLLEHVREQKRQWKKEEGEEEGTALIGEGK